jgi:hypothetical protein
MVPDALVQLVQLLVELQVLRQKTSTRNKWVENKLNLLNRRATVCQVRRNSVLDDVVSLQRQTRGKDFSRRDAGDDDHHEGARPENATRSQRSILVQGEERAQDSADQQRSKPFSRADPARWIGASLEQTWGQQEEEHERRQGLPKEAFQGLEIDCVESSWVGLNKVRSCGERKSWCLHYLLRIAKSSA